MQKKNPRVGANYILFSTSMPCSFFLFDSLSNCLLVIDNCAVGKAFNTTSYLGNENTEAHGELPLVP